jgi:hypothetical protein
MADFSHHGYDEFGWPLTSGQRLARMQGIGPDQGEYGRAYGTNGRQRETLDEPGLGFTLAEYEEAFMANEIDKIVRRRR